MKRPIDTIIAAYEKAWIDAVRRGVCTPGPSWDEVGALIDEVVNLRAQLAMVKTTS